MAVEQEIPSSGTARGLSLHWVVAYASVLLIIVCLFYVMFRLRWMAQRTYCQNTLAAVWCQFQEYSQDWKRYPSSLDDIIKGHYVTSGTILMCPATVHDQAGVPHGAYYTYINWSRYYDTVNRVPDDFPQLYDSALSNHGGRGINIVTINCRVFWDPDATWLRNFAAGHPQYDIPVP